MSPCAPSPASKTSAPTAVRGVLEREPGAGGEGSFKSPWAAPEEGREAEAESELLAAVSTDPAPPRALEALGDLYAGRRNFTEALDHYRQALVRTTDPRARQQLQLKISALGAPR